MKPGTVAQPAKSLTEAIEHALKMEWLAVKGESLPETGAEDRRLLLAAIAQGVLDYLKDHQDEFRVLLFGAPPTLAARLEIEAPALTLSPTFGRQSTEVTANGQYFGTDKDATLNWDDPPTILFTATVGSDGSFHGKGNVPDKAAPGEHVVAARDEDGHVALAVFTVSE